MTSFSTISVTKILLLYSAVYRPKKKKQTNYQIDETEHQTNQFYFFPEATLLGRLPGVGDDYIGVHARGHGYRS